MQCAGSAVPGQEGQCGHHGGSGQQGVEIDDGQRRAADRQGVGRHQRQPVTGIKGAGRQHQREPGQRCDIAGAQRIEPADHRQPVLVQQLDERGRRSVARDRCGRRRSARFERRPWPGSARPVTAVPRSSRGCAAGRPAGRWPSLRGRTHRNRVHRKRTHRICTHRGHIQDAGGQQGADAGGPSVDRAVAASACTARWPAASRGATPAARLTCSRPRAMAQICSQVNVPAPSSITGPVSPVGGLPKTGPRCRGAGQHAATGSLRGRTGSFAQQSAPEVNPLGCRRSGVLSASSDDRSPSSRNDRSRQVDALRVSTATPIYSQPPERHRPTREGPP